MPRESLLPLYAKIHVKIEFYYGYITIIYKYIL